MTTSGQARNTPGEPATGPAVPHGTATADDATATGTQAPENEQQLREEIEQTREELGQTVQQLVAKTDVKARARAKAAQLTGRVKDKATEVRAKAAGRSAGMRTRAAGKTVIARQKAVTAGGTIKSAVQARTAPVREATPEPVRRTLAKSASTARQRRVPLAVAAVTLAAGYLVLRRWRKR